MPLFDECINDLYEAWCFAIRRIWYIPWQTHCNMLPLIATVMDPEFGFAKRMINFLNMALNSSSKTVQWIVNMGRFGTYSIMGGNIRLLIYDMNEKKCSESLE